MPVGDIQMSYWVDNREQIRQRPRGMSRSAFLLRLARVLVLGLSAENTGNGW